MITKGLTSDHMKYCELRSCAKVCGGGCYLAKGSESASLPGPAAVVGEALKASARGTNGREGPSWRALG